MRHLDKRATKIMNEITKGMEGISARKIDNTPGFMALCIEVICTTPHQISLAHYYIQEGDMMRDPDVVFWKKGDDYYPMSFRQDPLFDHTYVRFEGGLVHVNEKAQHDLTNFSNQWLRNVADQQNITLATAD